MSNQKISELVVATALSGTETVPVVQGGQTKKTTIQDIIALAPGGVSSVAGKTGVVALVKADVGLANVNNTDDISKPISTDTQNALDLKADASDIVQSPGSLALFNVSGGALTGVPSLQYNSLGGINFYVGETNKISPPSNDYRNIHVQGMDMRSNEDILSEFTTLTRKSLQFDVVNDGHDYGHNAFGGIGLESNYLSHKGSGHIGRVDARNTYIEFGDENTPVAGTAGFVGISTDSVVVRPQYTLQNLLRVHHSGTEIRTNATITDYIGAEFNCRFRPSSACLGYLTGVRIISDHEASSTLLGNLDQLVVNTNINATASVAHLTGINTIISNNGTVTSGAGLRISFQGSGTYTNAPTGIQIDMGNYDITTSRRSTFSGNNGSLSNNTSFSTSSSLFTDNCTLITNNFFVRAGAPITGTGVLSHNFATVFIFEDDMALDPLALGAAGLGFVGQVGVYAGKTAHTVNLALGGCSIADVSPGFVDGPLGGTLENLNVFNGIGVVDFGGANDLVVDEVRVFTMGVGGLGTALWGIDIKEPRAENHLAKSLVIGAANVVSNSDVALELNDKKALKLTPMSITERNALVPLVGMIVYVSDSQTEEIQTYNGTSWVRTVQYVGVPATSASPGVTGQMAIETGWLYTCVASDTWERTATVTF